MFARTSVTIFRSRNVSRACVAFSKATFATTTSSKSTNFSKLPPEVQRELLRHVKPRNSNATTAKSSDQGAAATSKTYRWLLACVGFVGCAACLPYIATQTIGNLTDREQALNASSVRRGAFANSGSKDAGKDPNWDWKNGRYVYPKGFAEHLKTQSPDQTDFGPDLGPIVAEEKSRQQFKR
jgi:hypothetical protein